MKLVKFIITIAVFSFPFFMNVESSEASKLLEKPNLGVSSVDFVDKNLSKKTSFSLNKKKIKLTVESHGIKRTATGTSEVWVVLHNHTDFSQQVQARTMFFDEYQVPTDAAPMWKRVYIPAKSLGVYKELSVSATPATYRIEVKGAE